MTNDELKLMLKNMYADADEIQGYNPAPGPQRPEKYPAPPGEAYQYYGEQPGYVYDPYTDHYYPDPEAQSQYYDETGLEEKPKEDSLTDLVLPIAGASAVTALGAQVIKDPTAIAGISKIPGLFGYGATQAAPAAPTIFGAQSVGTGAATGAGAAGAGAAGAAPAAPTIIGANAVGGGSAAGAAGAAPAAPTIIGIESAGGAGATGAGAASGTAASGAGSATGGSLGGYAATAAPYAAAAVGGAMFVNAAAHALNAAKEDRTNREEQRWAHLATMGVEFDPSLLEQSSEDKFTNPEFSATRNESYLKPENITNAANWVQRYGPAWLELSPDAQKEIAGLALYQGAVREHHGTFDIYFTPEIEAAMRDKNPNAPEEWFDNSMEARRSQNPYALTMGLQGTPINRQYHRGPYSRDSIDYEQAGKEFWEKHMKEHGHSGAAPDVGGSSPFATTAPPPGSASRNPDINYKSQPVSAMAIDPGFSGPVPDPTQWAQPNPLLGNFSTAVPSAAPGTPAPVVPQVLGLMGLGRPQPTPTAPPRYQYKPIGSFGFR